MGSPLRRSFFVGVSTLVGCGVALYALFMVLASEAIDALGSILSVLSSTGPRASSSYWPPLALALAAVLIALAVNAWSLWGSGSGPRGRHFAFHVVTLAGTLVTLAFTLSVCAFIAIMHHPAWTDDAGVNAAARRREEDAALADENARQETRRRDMEERNAEIERDRRNRKP